MALMAALAFPKEEWLKGPWLLCQREVAHPSRGLEYPAPPVVGSGLGLPQGTRRVREQFSRGL